MYSGTFGLQNCRNVEKGNKTDKNVGYLVPHGLLSKDKLVQRSFIVHNLRSIH